MHDLGCHCIEAARYFFGKQDSVTEVMAWVLLSCMATKPKVRTMRF